MTRFFVHGTLEDLADRRDSMEILAIIASVIIFGLLIACGLALGIALLLR